MEQHGNSRPCLVLAAARGVDLHTTCRLLQVYTEAVTGLRHGDHPDGLNTTSLSPGHILGAASGGREGEGNPHSKGRGGVGASDCLGPGHGKWWSWPVVHRLQHPAPPARLLQPHVNLSSALRGQEGVSLARRWLLWQLSHCAGGRGHSNDTGAFKRKHRLRQRFPT